MGYWKNHNRYAEQAHKQKPWPIHEDTAMCGTTWYNTINQLARGDAWNILGGHYITARLNEANIGDVPQDIADTLMMAQGLMAQCSVTDADKAHALQLKDQLEQFNETDNCDVPVQEPEQPEVATTLVEIRSVYAHNGMDKSVMGLEAMSNPQTLPMSERSERFVRVWAHPDYEPKQLKGYAPIQPDGSVVFALPPYTQFSYEVVNKLGKKLNASVMQDSEFAYDHFTTSQVIASGAEGDVLCIDCNQNVNTGAPQANWVWPNTNGQITSTQAGQTMAMALHASDIEASILNTRMTYIDAWTPAPLSPVASIDLGYEGLTNKPVSVACEQELGADCIANITYNDHIEPLWSKGGRDEDGNSCVDCHDNRGFTKLDLSGYGQLSSLDALFGKQGNYMYLANRFSEVGEQHCRRFVEPPFAIQPENDCFSCYEQTYMSELGAISSANFFDLFDQDADDDHWTFKPLSLDDNAEQEAQRIRDLHNSMLTPQERKLIAEWLDRGMQ